jgi:hypothetical protein
MLGGAAWRAQHYLCPGNEPIKHRKELGVNGEVCGRLTALNKRGKVKG